MGLFEDCINCINGSAISDIVRVNGDDEERLGIRSLHADAGMMLAGTIPITDMRIVVSFEGQESIEGRVVVYPEFNDNYNWAKKNQKSFVLALVMTIKTSTSKKQALVPVFADAEGSSLVFLSGEEMYRTIDEKGKDITLIHKGPGEEVVHTLASNFIRWWYFIQVCLTNPPIRERFAALSRTKTIPKGDTPKKRGAVRYVKTHYLDPEEWGIIKRSESGRTYTCLAWYVIGHWREYKNGHRVFIKPYWKGTMRNSIEEAGDVSRNRIVAQIGEAVV